MGRCITRRLTRKSLSVLDTFAKGSWTLSREIKITKGTYFVQHVQHVRAQMQARTAGREREILFKCKISNICCEYNLGVLPNDKCLPMRLSPESEAGI